MLLCQGARQLHGIGTLLNRTINPSCNVHTCANRAVNRLPVLLARPA